MKSQTNALLIRADASTAMGTGHIMRMLALAQAWIDRGGLVSFACVVCPEILLARFADEGIRYFKISAAQAGDSADHQETTAIAQEIGANWVVLDGYHFDVTFQRYLRHAGLKVLAVDDYGHSESWAVDAILNQNLYASEVTYNTEVDHCKLLLGTKFALLRREFTRRKRPLQNTGVPLRKLLVTLGGGDPDNATGKILQLLEETGNSNLEIRVLVGGANPHRDELMRFANRSSLHIEILTDVRDMPGLYEWTDGVISAGGSTCWEWLYYGLPAAVVVIADNQSRVAKTLAEKGVAIDLGWHRNLQLENGSNRLNEWLHLGYSGTANLEKDQLVDGLGAQRVAAFLDNRIWLRPATAEDIEQYFEWVNDREVRQNAIREDDISWEEHCSWFCEHLRSDNSRLLVAMHEDTPVGQVRFDKTSFGVWEIDFSLANAARGKGLGPEMLHLAIKQLRIKGSVKLSAVVKANNTASRKCFDKLGFAAEPTNDRGLIHFALEV